MDRQALGDLARKLAAHTWTFTRSGVDEAALALGWEVGPQEGRLDLDTGGPFEPAWVICDGDEVYGYASVP